MSTSGGYRSGDISRTGVGAISHRQFWLDERGPERAYGVRHAYAPVRKVECRIDDGGAGLTSISVTSPIQMPDGSYRVYATARNSDERQMAVGVWESKDALNWSPRALGQVERNGRDTNFIRFKGVPGDQGSIGLPQVLRLPDGRWRMYAWKHREGHLRYMIAESDDGIEWTVPDFDRPALFHPADGGLWKMAEGLGVHETIELKLAAEEVLRRKQRWSNDSTSLYYNEHLDRFECYSVWLHPALADRRVDVDNAPGVHRLIHRRLSDDGIEWSDPELVIMPDERDPWDLQFYFLGVNWCEDFMVGSLGYYRVEGGQQTMDTDLCFSRDGRNWNRPVRGGWIPRTEGTRDSAGVYASNSFIDRGDCWLTLYTGTPRAHNAGVCETVVMGALFPKTRFVGLAADSTPGGFVTDPFFPSQPEITLDASIRGWLRAELCDAFGRKLPGYHLMDSAIVRGDSTAHVLRWNDVTTADRRFECVRLRFEFAEGEVWSLGF